MEAAPPETNVRLTELGSTAPTWAPWIPLVAIIALAGFWFLLEHWMTRTPRWWRLLPTSRLQYYGQIARFSDLLALLLEHGTPLGPAMVLAAEAGGDNRLQRSAQEFSQMIAAGVPARRLVGEAEAARLKFSGFPPLVSQLLASGGNQAALVRALRSTADAYHRRVERIDDWLRLYVPVGLTIGIGGTAVAAYALSLLGPWYQTLTQMGESLR
jgi:type II secretory pathway component PulF